jgi:hypothetical protein
MGNAEIRSPADGEWHSSVHAARPTMIVGREVRDIDNGASQPGAEQCDRCELRKSLGIGFAQNPPCIQYISSGIEMLYC